MIIETIKRGFDGNDHACRHWDDESKVRWVFWGKGKTIQWKQYIFSCYERYVFILFRIPYDQGKWHPCRPRRAKLHLLGMASVWYILNKYCFLIEFNIVWPLVCRTVTNLWRKKWHPPQLPHNFPRLTQSTSPRTVHITVGWFLSRFHEKWDLNFQVHGSL